MIADLAPMEVKLVIELPDEADWQFELKWDHCRAPMFRDGNDVKILSESGKSLARASLPKDNMRRRSSVQPRTAAQR